MSPQDPNNLTSVEGKTAEEIHQAISDGMVDFPSRPCRLAVEMQEVSFFKVHSKTSEFRNPFERILRALGYCADT